MHDAETQGDQDRLRPVSRVELLVDRRQMVLHRLLRQVQPSGDLWGRTAIGDGLQDLGLTSGDGVEWQSPADHIGG